MGNAGNEVREEIYVQIAKSAAKKAVDFLESRATGAARRELENALAALEKALQ